MMIKMIAVTFFSISLPLTPFAHLMPVLSGKAPWPMWEAISLWLITVMLFVGFYSFMVKVISGRPAKLLADIVVEEEIGPIQFVFSWHLRSLGPRVTVASKSFPLAPITFRYYDRFEPGTVVKVTYFPTTNEMLEVVLVD